MRSDRIQAVCALLIVSMFGAKDVNGQEYGVESNLPSSGYVDSDFPLELQTTGTLAPGESVALFLGDEDVSALLVAQEGGYRYPSSVLGLPVGRRTLTAFRVGMDGTWREVLRSEMRVRSGLGVEEATWSPKLDLSFTAQPDDGETPEPSSPREVPDILDGKFEVGLDLEHRDFGLQATSLLVGTSELNRRLRYRDLDADAPVLDLASYRLDHEQGPVALSVGHVRAGSQRHLIDGFGARGATATIRPTSRMDLNVGATAGSQSVGWGNLVGLGEQDHRVLSASMGLEAFERPGALRVEVGWMDGSSLPASDFNQGNVNDAETSNGLAVKVSAAGLDRRLRLDAGWAQSTFDNPIDPSLDQGQSVVDVLERTSDARYLDANLEVIRGLRLTGSRTARLSVGYKHERVDPLYRTLGANVRSDNLQDQFDVRADIAGIGVTGMFASAEDNLDEIGSILKSNTDRRSLNVTVPLSRMLREHTWLPSLSYRNDRTHQFGIDLPQNGGFSPGHIPDQVSVNQSVGIEVRGSKVSLRYQLNHSDQDNRQEGREAADFKTLSSGFGLALTPLRVLQFGLDLNLDRSDDLGADVRDNTRKWGVNASWRPLSRATLALRFSDTFQDDVARTREQTGRTLDVKWSSQIPKASSVGGTWFVRFNRRESGRIDRLRDRVQDRIQWTVNVGANLSLSRR